MNSGYLGFSVPEWGRGSEKAGRTCPALGQKQGHVSCLKGQSLGSVGLRLLPGAGKHYKGGGYNQGVYTPSQVNFLTAGRQTLFIFFKMRQLMRWHLVKSHTTNRPQRNEPVLEFLTSEPLVVKPGNIHPESWKTWPLKFV